MPEPPSIQTLGLPFIELQSIDSTNNYAREQIHANSLPLRQGLVQHGMAFFAHEQKKGKGQRGKSWKSTPGMNIALSIIIDSSPLKLAQQFEWSACVAVAVQEFFMKYASDDAKIKWPNDLYWQDRKAGGILIENIVGKSEEKESAQWKWSIAGIGININQTTFDPLLPNPVSLKQITGKNLDPVILAKELCVVVDKYFNELIKNGFENIHARYLHHLYKRNETVRLKKENRVFDGMIINVLPTGKLVVQHAIEEEFDFGEVEWVI